MSFSSLFSSAWIIPEMSSSDHRRLTCRHLTEALGVQQCWLCARPWWWRRSLQWCPPEPQSGPGHTPHSLWSLGGGTELHTLGNNKSEYIRNACGREQHLAQNIWYLVKRIIFFSSIKWEEDRTMSGNYRWEERKAEQWEKIRNQNWSSCEADPRGP